MSHRHTWLPPLSVADVSSLLVCAVCLSVCAAEIIRHLPLAKDVVLSARQELVMRLDGYVEGDEALFMEVGGA